MRKRKPNPKRRLQENRDPDMLREIAEKVRYTGNAVHKKMPNDYGLVPPTQPRQDKALCDGTGIKLLTAMKLLKSGARRGLISETSRGEFPSQIWAISSDGSVLEAKLENEVQGTYHGYPLPANDPLVPEVIERWNRSSSND